jgi:hypothetical protein
MANHLGCGQVLIACAGMRVTDQDDGKSQRKRSARGGVHAELRMHSANHEVRDRMLPEHLLQLRAMEGVSRRLAHAYVRCFDVKAAGKPPCIRFELEVTGIRFVLDEHHDAAGGTGLCRDLIDSLDNVLRLEGPVLTFAKALLDVDNK